MTQGYRNARTGYLTDMLVDTTPVGAVVPNLKAGRNSKDHFERPDVSATYPKLVETTGNAYLNADDPAWTHEGYLYCDGSIHNISDYVQLYEIIGNKYGGRSSSGVDVITGGQNYTTSSTVTISAPPAGGTQAVVAVGSVDSNGAITTMNVTNSGGGYTTAPTVSVATGTGATFQVRFDSTQGTILGISKANVMINYGDQYLGTFGVPDTKCRKVVGNGAVYGANSPNIGNSTVGTGTTGGKWYVDESAQDAYFTLGTIRTSGYDKVVETTECSIIGSQTVTVTMRETKLSGTTQHTHLLHNSIPGANQWIQEYSGDRYLVHYKPSTGKLDKWYPSTQDVLTHNHGLLRQPITDPEVASYDVLDYEGGRGGVGSIQNPYHMTTGVDIPYADQKYFASGDQSSGTTQLQTSISAPILMRFTPSSLIGGRQITSGGTPVYDYTNILVDTSNVGSGTASINVTGTPDLLVYNLMGGGGSGACGTTAGNAGGDSWLKIGPAGSEVINILAEGGEAGKASQAQNGGGATTAAQASSSGSVSITGTNGIAGGAGANTTLFVVDYPTNPGGGGTGGQGQTFIQNGTVYGGGTDGNRGKTNDSGSLSQTKTSGSHNFNISSVTATPSEVKFTLKGPKGADSSLDNYVGQDQAGGRGAWVQCFLNSSARSTFRSNTWGVKIGTDAYNTRNGGTGPAGAQQNGGYGGTGYNGAHGGGGGSSALLYRGGTLIAGAGGGGGAGADGYDGGDGQHGGYNPGNAAGITGGSLRKVGGNTGLDAGYGGPGGGYGCRGGGGGGGGAGCAENGFSGFGGGGGGGTPGSGGHDGGDGGKQGPSAVRTLYFESNTAQLSWHTGYTASIKMDVTWDGSYWHAAGGGGGGGAYFKSNISWSQLNNPSSISWSVGGAGSGVSNGGQSTGNAGSGYIKVAIGTITGYVGGTTTTTTGDVIASASQTSTSFDVNIFSGGAGTGTAGFKLPTTQVPVVVFKGGGLSDPPASPNVHATATCTVSSTLHKVTAITLGTTAGTNNGYTEKPYVYVLGGAGTMQTCTANIDAANSKVSALTFATATAQKAERYLKFGGTVAATRWVETVAFDTTNANYFTIKACRGNGVNGGDVPEESLLCYYKKGGTTTWVLLDTIINPGADRPDPLMGTIPSVANGMATDYDGISGDTQWHSYSVPIPQHGRGIGTTFKLEQIRTSSGSDNSSDSDHYGICELAVYNQKTTSYVFVADPGAVSRPLVDSLSYTVEGESGPAFTYSSGLGCGDATLTLKSTTKIEPVATIDPDYDIPLVHPYHVCKYLIKAY